jgi:peroxiredoxin
MANKLAVLANAPDFELIDTTGAAIHLAEINKEKPVVLVLMRGFV